VSKKSITQEHRVRRGSAEATSGISGPAIAVTNRVEILRLGAGTPKTQDDNHFKTLFSKAGVVGGGSDFAEGLAGYVLCGVRIGR